MVPACRRSCCGSSRRRRSSASAAPSIIHVDVRVIAATNRNLQEEVKQGRFREDLFYRLNVLPIALPPLRAAGRRHPAARHVLHRRLQHRVQEAHRGVTPDAMQQLQRYPWPGNVRELRNAVERAMLLAEGDTLTARRTSTRPPSGVVRLERAGRAAGRRHRPRAARTLACRPGARADRLEPDARGHAARPEPRSDPLSHREVPAREERPASS